MQRCYHRECDTARLRGRDRSLGQEPDYSFLALTVQTLVDSVVEMTGAQCPLSQRGLRYLTSDSENSANCCYGFGFMK